MKTRLGWLGPVIVLVGIVAAGLATWLMVASRPKVGAVIDTIPINDKRAFVVRAEADGNRNFVELREGDRVVWQALVPPYGGRAGAPGIAWNDSTVSIRVIRDGRAEIFAIAMQSGSKLGGLKLAPDHGSVVKQTSGPVTLTDHVRSYEIVAGSGWHMLAVIDLASGEPRWKQELGASVIEAGGVQGDIVWIRQDGQTKRFRAVDGTPAM
jgi:outer membrane protein assembly factor BamB